MVTRSAPGFGVFDVEDVELLAVEHLSLRRVGEGDDAVAGLRGADETAQRP
jgi:hypothetical protein